VLNNPIAVHYLTQGFFSGFLITSDVFLGEVKQSAKPSKILPNASKAKKFASLSFSVSEEFFSSWRESNVSYSLGPLNRK